MLQKPVTLPGWPSLPRPTSALHEEQNRLVSGTTGISMTAVEGSTGGISGNSTSGVPVLQRDPLRTAPTVTEDLLEVVPVVGAVPRPEVPMLPRLALPEVLGIANATFPHTVQ